MKEKSGPITLSAMKESFNKMGFPMSVYSDDDDRVRFNRGSWTVMLSKALDKYNDTIVHQPK